MGIDPRFYRRLARLTADEIAGHLQSGVTGDTASVAEQVGPASEARPGDLVFVSSPDLPDELKVRPGVVIGPGPAPALESLAEGVAYIVHRQPRGAFGRVARLLFVPLDALDDLADQPAAVIHPSARIGEGAVISKGAEIAEDVIIGANAVIGPGVRIGPRSRIGANAVIGFCEMGHDCRIGPGAVIGEEGFGVAPGPGGLVDLPHFGRVMIGNGVRIGANCTIDRGMFGDTIVRDRVRLDNLCHIAHNVDVGEDTLMAAFAGVSGSVKIGRGAQFGGRVGILDHVTIGEGARLAVNASPAGDVPPGETWAGQPAQPIRRWLRELAILKKLAAPRIARVDGQGAAGQDRKSD